MPLWTLFGLRKGKATTAWPKRDQENGQEGVLGMPRIEPQLCEDGCAQCAAVCPTEAIRVPTDQTGAALLHGYGEVWRLGGRRR